MLCLFPISPVEMQAVAGCPLLPHVYVLPHSAIPAAGHRAEGRSSQTHPQAVKPAETLLTGQRISAKNKLSKRLALAECFQCCCLPLCLHYSSSPSLCVMFGGASWLQNSSFIQHLKTNADLFWLKDAELWMSDKQAYIKKIM